MRIMEGLSISVRNSSESGKDLISQNFLSQGIFSSMHVIARVSKEERFLSFKWSKDLPTLSVPS